MSKVLPHSRRSFSSALAIALAASTLLAGCGLRHIPGTQIPDNSDTRAIVALIDAYRESAERRDSAAVLALVSPKYFDDGGTPDPGDDVDYEQLQKRLTEDFEKLSGFRLDIAVRKIDVTGDEAAAYVYYDEHYRIMTRSGEVAKQASDLHRMKFVKEGGTWRFRSGL
jgi:hypothetical protein